jgi:hypothetical protein
MFQQSSDYISRSITTHGQLRRLPHQGARHGTVDHGDASYGVFLLHHLWVLPSSWAILLQRSPSSLSILWMASRCGWLSLLRMAAPPRTEGWKSFGCKKGGGVEPTLGLGQAGWPGPTGPGPSRRGLVAPSLPWVLMHLCTFVTPRVFAEWWFVLMTLLTTPLTTLENPRSTLGQNPSPKP